MTLTTRATCHYSFVFTANTLLSVTSVVLVVFRLSSETEFRISTATGCELYGTIILSAGKIPFTHLSMKEIPSRKETAKFLTIPYTTRTWAFPLSMSSIIVPAAPAFLSFVEYDATRRCSDFGGDVCLHSSRDNLLIVSVVCSCASSRCLSF